MEAAYWQKAWSDNRIGFHQKNVNKWLSEHWSSLQLAEGSRVFVPLCGKSTDMLWLHKQGHIVLGIELSARAAEDFYNENSLEYRVSDQADFRVFSGIGAASGLDIWVGDFFDLKPQHLQPFDAYYDRAAMVALPDALRVKYATHMAFLIPEGARALLLTFSYIQANMDGPPFSVSDENVRKLLGQSFDICELEHYSGTDRLGNLADRGLETLDERVYLLTRN